MLIALCTGLGLASDSFLSLGNLTSLLNNNAVNVIWAVGLLVVLIAGGIDISFAVAVAVAVAASVVQYLCVHAFAAIGGGNNDRVLPVVVALFVLQVLSSGLNLLGANQHLSTAAWGLFLIGVMVLCWAAAKLRQDHREKG